MEEEYFPRIFSRIYILVSSCHNNVRSLENDSRITPPSLRIRMHYAHASATYHATYLVETGVCPITRPGLWFCVIYVIEISAMKLENDDLYIYSALRSGTPTCLNWFTANGLILCINLFKNSHEHNRTSVLIRLNRVSYVVFSLRIFPVREMIPYISVHTHTSYKSTHMQKIRLFCYRRAEFRFKWNHSRPEIRSIYFFSKIWINVELKCGKSTTLRATLNAFKPIEFRSARYFFNAFSFCRVSLDAKFSYFILPQGIFSNKLKNNSFFL